MTQEEARVFFEFWVGQVIAPGFFVCTISIIVTSLITNYLRFFADKNKEEDLDENRDLNKEFAENFKNFREKVGNKYSGFEKLFIVATLFTLYYSGSLTVAFFKEGMSLFAESNRSMILFFSFIFILIFLLFLLFNLAKKKRIEDGTIKDDKNISLIPTIVSAVMLFLIFFGLVMFLKFS